MPKACKIRCLPHNKGAHPSKNEKRANRCWPLPCFILLKNLIPLPPSEVSPTAGENPRSVPQGPSKRGTVRSYHESRPDTDVPQPASSQEKTIPCSPASRTAMEEVRPPDARNTGCKDSPESPRRAAGTPRPSGTPE